MKKLAIYSLVLLLVFEGCSKKETSINFLGCQLSKVVYSGEFGYIDDYTYDASGNKTKWVRTDPSIGGTYTETYVYTNGKLSQIVDGGLTRYIEYNSDLVSKITGKSSDGAILFTDTFSWNGNVLTITEKNSSDVLLHTDEFTISGQDVSKELHTEFNGSSPSFKEELVYTQFDNLYNPEYLSSPAYPSSLHNYNRIDITVTDYSTTTPTVSTFNYTYQVTANKTNAVSTRTRTRSDTGDVLVRNYTYAKCS